MCIKKTEYRDQFSDGASEPYFTGFVPGAVYYAGPQPAANPDYQASSAWSAAGHDEPKAGESILIGSFVAPTDYDKPITIDIGPRFQGMTNALFTPGGEVFRIWADQVANALPPAEALRTIFIGLLTPLGGLIGSRPEVERLVEGWVEKVAGSNPTAPITKAEVMALAGGLYFGMRIGQLTAASHILAGNTTEMVSAAEAAKGGGLPTVTGDFPAFVGQSETVRVPSFAGGNGPSGGDGAIDLLDLILGVKREALAAQTGE